MSVPVTPPTTPMRRQLDELDALLQRMLELPVEAEPPSETLLANDVHPAASESWVLPSLPELPPSLEFSAEPPASLWLNNPEPEDPAFEPFPLEVPPTLLEGDRPPTTDNGPSLPDVRHGLLLRLDDLFVAVCGRLGAPGRWLRGPGGRALLGVTGLVCLGAALALAIHAGIGWTR